MEMIDRNDPTPCLGKTASQASRSTADLPGARSHDTPIAHASGDEKTINRERIIAEIAYLMAERRGFAPGSDLDDWLAAEKEVDQLISLSTTPTGHPSA